MKFIYGEIRVIGDCIGKDYKFGDYTTSSLLTLLDYIGAGGWELVGEIERKIIVKKRIEE